MDRANASSLVTDVVTVLPLAQRQARVLAIVGDDALDPALPGFRAILGDEVRRLFDRVVLPLATSSWPGLRDDRFLPKWRGGFDLYGALGLSTLVTSTKRPSIVDLSSRFLRRIGAGEDLVVAAGRFAIPVVFRLLDSKRCERVALGAAWILVLDEALDEGLAGRPIDEQKAIMRGVLHGLAPTNAPPSVQTAARFTRAVRDRCVDAHDVAAFEALVVSATDWVDGELHALCGDVDPHGTRWRQAGVTGSMDVLLWAVGDYAATSNASCSTPSPSWARSPTTGSTSKRTARKAGPPPRSPATGMATPWSACTTGPKTPSNSWQTRWASLQMGRFGGSCCAPFGVNCSGWPGSSSTIREPRKTRRWGRYKHLFDVVVMPR